MESTRELLEEALMRPHLLPTLLALGLTLSCFGMACGDDDDPAANGDAPLQDAGGDEPDATPDTTMDTGAPDAQTPMDAGRPDANPPQDADAPQDGGAPQDAGPPDAQKPDADEPDADTMDVDETDADEPDVPPVTSHFNIDVLGALIGPGKSDRTQWDGFGDVPDELWLGVAILVELPVQDALDFVSMAATQSLAKPDPYGTTEIDMGDGWEQPLELAARTNTFQPLFDNVSYTNISSQAQLRLKVELWDEDVALDDPIGAVIISRDDILDAVEAGGSWWVNTAAQSNGQIIYVQIAAAEFSD